MPRRAKVDWRTVRAAAPHRVARVSQLVRLGVPRSTIQDRCCPDGGMWQRPLPGVVVMHSGPPTSQERLAAALAYAGPDALLTGAEVCRRRGLRRVPTHSALHLLIPDDQRRASAGFVIVERTTRLPGPAWLDEVPCAPIVRAVLDAARRMRRIDEVRALLSEAVQRGMCRPRSLLAELDAGCSAGSALPRTVLREVLVGTRSVAESWALGVWRRSGLPALSWNVPIYDADGRFLAVPDGWLESVGLAWEIDSYEWHLSPEDYARTLRRNSRLTAAGVIVVQTLPSRLRDDPQAVADELVAAYHHATCRPRPAVSADLPPAA